MDASQGVAVAASAPRLQIWPPTTLCDGFASPPPRSGRLRPGRRFLRRGEWGREVCQEKSLAALLAVTAATPAGAAHLPGGAVQVLLPIPLPFVSREKSSILLGSGDALGTVTFLKALFWEQRWVVGFVVV